MPVLQFLENEARQIAHPFAQFGTALAALPAGVAADVTNNPIAQANLQKRVFGTTNTGQMLRDVGSDTAQIGLNVVAPEAFKAAQAAIPVAGAGGAALAGAAAGAPIGGAFNVAGAEGNNGPAPSAGKLTMNFLQGAATGGVLGAAGGAVGSIAKQFFGDAKLSKMATSENASQIEKDIKPVTGPVVAQKIAPAIAKAGDKNVVANVIDNAMEEHNPSIANAAPPAPSPTPPLATDITTPSVSGDVNPAGQGSSATLEPTEAVTPGVAKSPELEAQQGMQSILNQGGTVDEALNHHMETTGGNISDAQKALAAVRGAEGTDVSQINAKLNPRFNELDIPKADSSERAILNSRMVRNAVTRAGNTATEEVDKLSPQDLQLMDQLRGNRPEALVDQAKDKFQFLKAASAVKNYNDLTQSLAAKVGQDVPYRQNYGAPLLFDRSSEEGDVAFQNAVSKLKTQPGYGKGRFFNSYDEAAQLSNGDLKRANPNFLGDLHQDIMTRQNDLSQLTLAKGLEEAHPGQVAVGQLGSGENGVYRQLQIPGGSKISMPSEIASEINKRAPATQPGGILKGYDTLNSNFKNLKLAGGGFHSLNVVGTYLGQGLGSGRIATPGFWRDLGKITQGTFSDKGFSNEIERMNQNGTLVNADAAGLVHNMKGVEADVKSGPIVNKVPGLGQIHDAIFGRQIPLLKLETFERLTSKLDRNNPDDLAKMTDIAKEINQNYGGLNREVQGFTPSTFARMARAVLATDYNEGQIRTVIDAFSKGGAEGKLARQVVFGKALLFGGISTGIGAAGGEFKGQTPKQVAFNIIEKMVNPKASIGSFTASLPTTQLSELGKPLEETISNAVQGRSLKSPFENFASARLAAVPSAIEQYASNKNFYGEPIHGTDFYGRPVSTAKTLENIAGLATPIPVTQGIQAQEGNATPASVAANIAGLNVRPTNSVQYAPIYGQTYLQALQQTPGVPKEQIQADQQFFSAMGSVSGKKQAETQAEKDLATGNQQKALKDIQAYNLKLLQALKPWATSEGSKYFDSTMSSILSSSLLKMSTINNNMQYAKKTNPTSIGLPVQALNTGSQ